MTTKPSEPSDSSESSEPNMEPVESGSEPLHTFRTRRRVEFADTDMGRLVHFSRFFVFMETAEHELLRAIGTPVHFTHDGHQLGWPRLAARCEYVSPARYGDQLEIEVRVVRK